MVLFPTGTERALAAMGEVQRVETELNQSPDLRDDPVVTHALVREVSALFDATIVRVEAAGTLPASAAAGAQAAEAAREEGRDDVDPLESLLHGEHDV